MLRSCNHEEHLAGPLNMCSTEGQEMYSVGMSMRPSCSASSGEILTCVPCMLLSYRHKYPFITNKEATLTWCVLIFKYQKLYPFDLFWISTVQNSSFEVNPLISVHLIVMPIVCKNKTRHVHFQSFLSYFLPPITVCVCSLSFAFRLY